MINFDPQFYFFEVGIWDDQLSKDAGRNHSDQGFHLWVIWVEGIWDNIIDLVGGLVF